MWMCKPYEDAPVRYFKGRWCILIHCHSHTATIQLHSLAFKIKLYQPFNSLHIISRKSNLRSRLPNTTNYFLPAWLQIIKFLMSSPFEETISNGVGTWGDEGLWYRNPVSVYWCFYENTYYSILIHPKCMKRNEMKMSGSSILKWHYRQNFWKYFVIYTDYFHVSLGY